MVTPRPQQPPEARVPAPPTTDREGAAGGLYVSQVAAMLGVSTSAIRLWEDEGLITPRRSKAGYRLFGPADLRRLIQIRDLRDEGINGTGVRKILEEESQAPPLRPASDLDTVGARLRALRIAAGYTLRTVANKAGLSPSYLSSIERSLSNPSIASLQKLTAVLGSNIVTILGDDSPIDGGEVVRAADRPLLQSREDGVTMHRLARTDTQLEPLLFTIDPGSGSAGPYEHEGEEFIYVTAGSFEIVLDGSSVHRLHVGDSITFRSRRPHTWLNPGQTTCVLVWINTPPTF
jgi:DNA-binding transcriptional MerR regulator/quercetin dioxygenase-like cupin family protein